MILVVPNYISEAIHKKISQEWAKHHEEEMPESERACFYRQLLNYVNDHGAIPDFTIEAN